MCKADKIKQKELLLPNYQVNDHIWINPNLLEGSLRSHYWGGGGGEIFTFFKGECHICQSYKGKGPQISPNPNYQKIKIS